MDITIQKVTVNDSGLDARASAKEALMKAVYKAIPPMYQLYKYYDIRIEKDIMRNSINAYFEVERIIDNNNQYLLWD